VNTSLPWRVEEAADDGLYSGMFSKFHVSKQTAPSTAKGGSPAEQDAGSGQSKFKSIVVTQSAFPALYRARDRAVFHRDADAVEELEGGVEIAEGEHKSFTEARADRGRVCALLVHYLFDVFGDGGDDGGSDRDRDRDRSLADWCRRSGSAVARRNS